jgi:RNA polymerase sigma factor (TIGR02999 family)
MMGQAGNNDHTAGGVNAAGAGDPSSFEEGGFVHEGHSALDRLVPGLYDELKRIAQAAMREERLGHTLQATALANEAYLRLRDQRHFDAANRSHFFATAATLIRRILVDSARARAAAKRGGGAARVTLTGLDLAEEKEVTDVLDLEEALKALTTFDPKLARIIELRYFGGLAIAEIAEQVNFSTRKVEKDLAFAHAWLRKRMSEGGSQT